MPDTVLHVHGYGPDSGRPVLALHGVTGHAQRWRPLADALPWIRLLALDVRGHGCSPWAPPWGLEQHVADALAVMDGLGLASVPVIGHSFGGAIALHLAAAAPERVQKLVLLDPALGLDPGDMLTAAENGRADERYPDRAAARAAQAARWAGLPDRHVDAELAAHLVPDGDGWRFRYSRAAVVAAWSEMARPAITPPPGLPTLLVPATGSGFVDPAWVRRCRAACGDALTVAEIDSGHMLYLERTAEVAELAAKFLAG